MHGERGQYRLLDIARHTAANARIGLSGNGPKWESYRLLDIARHAVAALVQQPDVELRVRVAELGRTPVPEGALEYPKGYWSARRGTGVPEGPLEYPKGHRMAAESLYCAD